MIMKRYVLMLVLLLLCIIAGAQDSADCIVKTGSKWGAACDHCEIYTEGFKRDFSGTYQVQLRNVCKEIIEVKLAVQEKNGEWRTFPVRALAPEETFDGYACQGTGKYVYWARAVSDTEILLPSDREIISEYRGR
jgi:hypothetical protein